MLNLRQQLSKSQKSLFIFGLFISFYPLLQTLLSLAGSSCEEIAVLICLPIYGLASLIVTVVFIIAVIKDFPRPYPVLLYYFTGFLYLIVLAAHLNNLYVQSAYFPSLVMAIQALMSEFMLLGTLYVVLTSFYQIVHRQIIMLLLFIIVFSIGFAVFYFPQSRSRRNDIVQTIYARDLQNIDYALSEMYRKNGSIPDQLMLSSEFSYVNTIDPGTLLRYDYRKKSSSSWEICYISSGENICRPYTVSDSYLFVPLPEASTIPLCEPVASGMIRFEGVINSEFPTKPAFTLKTKNGEININFSNSRIYSKQCEKLNLIMVTDAFPNGTTRNRIATPFNSLDRDYLIGAGNEQKGEINATWVIWVNSPPIDQIPL